MTREEAERRGPALPPLPERREALPRTALGRWLRSDRLDEAHGIHGGQPWYMVLWLTGVDYFSTLGYQPGIALLAAGALSPVATLILVAVTLLGALPIYSQVAARSYAGQGSIAMLEGLLTGWTAKILVLVLLGFAATDFVITITLSASDAAQHAVENPFLHGLLGEHRLLVTLAILAPLAAVFLAGFGEAIRLAAAICIPYLLLNLVVLARAIVEIAHRPEVFDRWREALALRGDPAAIALASLVIFPKLALGMSGFETGVTVMPLVAGEAEDSRRDRPWGRVRATRRLLVAAALIMSVLLIVSSLVSTLLVPESAYRTGGPANGRAIAWLAHLYLGEAFGSIYDLSTILILWFAGASAMAGLLNLIPRYLPRYGMAPQVIAYRRPLVLVIFAICLVVTVVFRADVDKQGGAYATGVLVLMLSAAVAVALSFWRERLAAGGGGSAVASVYFWIVSVVFAFTLVDNVVERPDGVIIASVFIVGIVAMSAVSRYSLAKDLRVSEVGFADDASAALWPSVCGKKVHLAPLRGGAGVDVTRKAAELRKYYAIEGPVAFLHVRLVDNRSEFLAPLRLAITRAGGDFVIEVSGAVAMANTIAYVSELVDPRSLFLGLTRQNLMTQSLRHLLWGEGETALLVYEILVRYWDWTPEDDVRPMIFMMSD